MKLKPLVVTVIILAALSGAAYFLTRSPASSADLRNGQPVVDRAIIEKAAQLRLTGNGTTVLFVKQPDTSWRVASYYDLPANFDKLLPFVDELTNAKVLRFVTANPDRLTRLEFADRQIALLDADGHELWSLTIGKRADAGGCFVRFGAEQKAYLASLDTWIDTVAKNWTDSTLLDLKPSEVARLEIGFDAAPPVVVSCAKASAPFAATPTPAGQQLAMDKFDSLLNQLIKLHFSDTSDPANPDALAARQHARAFKLTTFEGKTYTLALGCAPAVASPAAKSQTTGSPAGPVYAFIACSDPSAPVNALMQKRACQIPGEVYTSLPEKPGDLFMPEPPPTAPAALPAAKP
jgi:hypothetical protein